MELGISLTIIKCFSSYLIGLIIAITCPFDNFIFDKDGVDNICNNIITKKSNKYNKKWGSL